MFLKPLLCVLVVISLLFAVQASPVLFDEEAKAIATAWIQAWEQYCIDNEMPSSIKTKASISSRKQNKKNLKKSERDLKAIKESRDVLVGRDQPQQALKETKEEYDRMQRWKARVGVHPEKGKGNRRHEKAKVLNGKVEEFSSPTELPPKRSKMSEWLAGPA